MWEMPVQMAALWPAFRRWRRPSTLGSAACRARIASQVPSVDASSTSTSCQGRLSAWKTPAISATRGAMLASSLYTGTTMAI